MAKLITETSYLFEIKKDEDGKNLFIEGVFASAEKTNRNKRKYKKDILEREIGEFTSGLVKEKRGFGELNHPDKPEINLERAAILIEDLKWKGEDVWGKARVLDTPLGKIVKNISEAGGKLGISSRGLGTVNENGYVNEDYKLITFDIVANPSNYGSWVNGIYEGKEFEIEHIKVVNPEEKEEEARLKEEERIREEEEKKKEEDKKKEDSEEELTLDQAKAEYKDYVAKTLKSMFKDIN